MSFVGSVERLRDAALDEGTGTAIPVGEYGTIVPGVAMRGRTVEKTGNVHITVPKAVGKVAVSVNSLFVVLGRLNIDPSWLNSSYHQPAPDFLLRQQFEWDTQEKGRLMRNGVVALRSLSMVEAKYADDEWSLHLKNLSGEATPPTPPHLKLHLYPDSGFWTPKEPHGPTVAQAAVLAAVGEAAEHLAPFKELGYSPFPSAFVTYPPKDFDALTNWMLNQDPA